MRVWKPIKGYEGLYEISSDGFVKSLERVGVDKNGRLFPVKERILTLKLPNGAFYYQIILYRDSKYKLHRIHRLVAESFNIKQCETQEVNHKNGDRLDNNCTNLEWVSKSENIRHSHEILKQDNGEDRYNSKLTEENVREIRLSEISNTILAKKYKVSRTCIHQVKTKKTWKQIKD